MTSIFALIGIFVVYILFVLFVTIVCKAAVPDERFDTLFKDIAKWASPFLFIALISNIYDKF